MTIPSASSGSRFCFVLALLLLLPVTVAARQPTLSAPALQIGGGSASSTFAGLQDPCTEEPLSPGVQFVYGGRVVETDDEGSTDVAVRVEISGVAEFVVGTQGADRGTWTSFTSTEGVLFIGTTTFGEEIDFWFDIKSTGSGTATYTFTASDEGGPRGTFTCDFIFGEAPGGLSGMKWNDADGDGRLDTDEEGLEGWTIRLNTGESTTTDGNGFYSFTDLEPGTYTVSEEQQDFWTQTYPQGSSHTVTLESGEFVEGLNFGNQQMAGSLVLEVDFVSVLLEIFTVEEWPVGKTGVVLGLRLIVTNASSEVARNVIVEDELPAEFRPSIPDPETNSVCQIELITVLCELGDLDPQQSEILYLVLEPQEAGIFVNTAVAVSENVPGGEGSDEIVIYDPAEDLEGTAEPEEQTITQGEEATVSFRITNTSDDARFVPASFQSGTGLNILSASTTEGTCGETDDGATVCVAEVESGGSFTTEITFEGTEIGTSTMTAIVGDYEIAVATVMVVEEPSLQLCGQKFLDIDGDGEQDDDEPGLGGVTIELLDAAGTVVGTTRTDAADLDQDGFIDPFGEQGRFCFEDLPPGTYTVREVVPPGYEQTAPAPPGTVTVELTGGSQLPIRFGNVPLPVGDPPDDTPPDSVAFDFGDLPDPRRDVTCPPGRECYPTLFVNLGPWHVIDPDGPHLGTTVDEDGGGQPDATALGDDVLDGSADEDGLVGFSVLGDGSIQFELEATVPPGTPAFVDAWVDLNDDGLLETIGPGVPPPPEYVLVRRPVADGKNTLTTAPGLVDPDQQLGYARFRITSTGVSFPILGALDGEVEDYLLLGADFGDAPSAVDPSRPDFPGGYPTTLAQDGARHVASPNTRLGDHLDADQTVEGSFDAREDDEDLPQDDEDGIIFLDGFTVTTDGEAGEHVAVTQGTAVSLLPLPSVDGKLDAWVDWNRDGDWEDAGEQIFASVDIGPQMDEDDALTMAIPDEAATGFTYVRFRFSRLGGLTPTGAAMDGEVEDYLLSVGPASAVSVEDRAALPDRFVLHGNYPNPFNPQTTLRFDLPWPAEVRLEVFDLLGRRVMTVAPRVFEAGASRTLQLDASSLPSGLYVYRLTAETATDMQVATGYMVLIK